MDVVALLQSCAKTKDVHRGIRAHASLLRRALLERSSYVANVLLMMYVKCGALHQAEVLLAGLPIRTVVSWTTLIGGYAQLGKGEEALNLLELMRAEGVSPNAVTFVCILKACGSLGAADKGEQIHDEITRQGLLTDNPVLGNALVDMYAKCGALQKAHEVLDELHSRDVISWTTVIAGYAQHGQCMEAINCFERMQREGISPNKVTFLCILKAYGGLGAADKGEEIHHEIARLGLLGKDVALGSALVDMYAKCGALAKARQMLEEHSAQDVVSWTALIKGYVEHGQSQEALECFERMQDKGVQPNSVTYTGILNACGSLGAADKGEEIHDQIARQGLLRNNVVLGCALLDMYAKCGVLAKAREVFQELPARDVVAWTALITGYVQRNEDQEAFDCFRRMKDEGITPNSMTLACILKACGSLGAFSEGKRLHDEITRQGLLREDRVLGSALVDMYVKCGMLSIARKVLEELPTQDVVSWTALIAGYFQHGQSEDAFDCFEAMQKQGHSPNDFTLSCILSLCSHVGLLDEGQMYFANMNTKYGAPPNLVHYACMIDLFGRSGHLDKAVALIQKMPSYDNSTMWHTLLGACQRWKDVNVGRWAFGQAVQVDETDVAAYVLMANIYAAVGMQEEAASVEIIGSEIKVKNYVGHSCWVDTYGTSDSLAASDMECVARESVSKISAGNAQEISLNMYSKSLAYLTNNNCVHTDKLSLVSGPFSLSRKLSVHNVSEKSTHVATSLSSSSINWKGLTKNPNCFCECESLKCLGVPVLACASTCTCNVCGGLWLCWEHRLIPSSTRTLVGMSQYLANTA